MCKIKIENPEWETWKTTHTVEQWTPRDIQAVKKLREKSFTMLYENVETKSEEANRPQTKTLSAVMDSVVT